MQAVTSPPRTYTARFELVSDRFWNSVQHEFPRPAGRPGRRFSDARTMVEAIIYRQRCAIPWRQVPEVFGHWQTIWTWNQRILTDGSWERARAEWRRQSPDEKDPTRPTVQVEMARVHRLATSVARRPHGWVELEFILP
ncbi:transposase [Herbiconiux sp. A18JL235]|uniref:Transposase n=1 Tax=Herbiconiux sp. A18JL235 TaxID=3152363 RepID=A0AB39BI97_9MICO